MRIGLFALETGRNVGGLEIYETELIRALARVDHVNEYHVFSLDRRVPEILGVTAPNFHLETLPVNRWRGVVWDAPRAMARAGLDMFHALFVPPPFTALPYVFTHHGSEVLQRPDFYPWALGLRMNILFRRALARAKRIICVSHYVQDHLANDRRVPPHRLTTVYHGCHPAFHPLDPAAARAQVARKHDLHAPFILNVGRIEPRKNPIRLLEAYDRFRRTLPRAPMLVFAGAKKWGGPAFDRAVARLGLGGCLRELGHLPHSELPELFSAAEFVVFASLWEGFGLPALEAMSAGAPLITSRTTSLPEVVGNAALLIDPTSAPDIAAAMTALYLNPSLREELRQRGLARARRFSWDQSARETVEVYQDAGNDRPRASGGVQTRPGKPC